ncbi:MAG TPA: ABC transporter substrate-binding protein [Mycobacteriales bacterium]|nr:ABC transporter substrate-binding protein [Mycobacteriales bacterium]
MTSTFGKRRTVAASAAGAALLITLAACGSSSSGGGSATDTSSTTGTTDWSTTQSAADGGGMDALVAAAKAEGTLNVITLPRDWANYGNIMDSFSKKYGIKINDANPDGSSQDEINAMQQLKGQSRAPDVLDMGTSFAITATNDGLLAPYKVATWNDIPAAEKDADGHWFDDYGGYVSIGYDPSKVKTPPTSFKDLLNPIYKNQVGINGDPTETGAGFAAVYAAALANGGSFANIKPGIDYFKQLKSVGNFVPGTSSATTVQSGQTPIFIYWDYLQASEVAPHVPGYKIVIPTDGQYASYYSQAISASAPDPAAARLWEEYLYSQEGQNLWLQGFARPAELGTLVSDGTVDEAAYKALPAVPDPKLSFPTAAQLTAAQAEVAKDWPTEVGG